MDLKQIFDNNFDCYAELDKQESCLPETYDDKMAMAMTKDKFIEVVEKILSDGKKQQEPEATALSHGVRRRLSPVQHFICKKEKRGIFMIKEFILGAVKWTVKEDNNRLDDLNFLGLCEFPKSLISIYNKEVDDNLVNQTIYHEVVHAILESIGETALSANDKFVQNFALLLHQFENTKK